MRRSFALLRGAAACLIIAVASGPALAKQVPVERRIVHPNGASILLQAIEFRDDSIVLSATIANPGEREIRLNRARSCLLDDGAHGVHHLNPPADNPELRIPARAQVTGDLVFIGPLAPAARQLTLSSNQGIGTPDNPYDDAPEFKATLPADGHTEGGGGSAASHPDGAALRVRQILDTPNACVVSLLATNGNDRTIVLNQDRSLVLTDDHGISAPLKAPVENLELVVPPGDRLDADLVFDCRTLDAGGALTLITNRGTAGTTDNPYDTLPVFTLRAPVERSDASPPASSRAAVAPIARSLLSAAAATAAAVAATPPAATSPAATGPATPVPPPPFANPVSAKSPGPSSVAQLEAALHAAKTDRGLLIVLPADELFGAARDTLDANADPLLAQLAELIAATHPREVVVAGHTDSSGTDEDNQTLSDERAHAVAIWLETRSAKRQPRFVEQGYGRTRPVAPNHAADGSDNPEGRARNRRVEITLRR